MLSLARFIKVLARRHATLQADPFAPVVTQWRVMPGDVDVFGHMNNSRYQVVMDLGRIDYLRRCGLFRPFVRHRLSAPVGGVQIAYRSSLKPFERYEMHTRLVWWDERWFYFRHDFCRPGEAQRPACFYDLRGPSDGPGFADGAGDLGRDRSGVRRQAAQPGGGRWAFAARPGRRHRRAPGPGR